MMAQPSRFLHHATCEQFDSSQGEALIPGERAEAVERFTPADGSGVVFIKLSDGRGYVQPIGPLECRRSQCPLGTMHSLLHTQVLPKD